MKWEIMSWDGKLYTTIHEPDGKRHFVSEDDGKFNKAQVTTIRNRIGRRAYKKWLKEYKESLTILERMKFLGAASRPSGAVLRPLQVPLYDTEELPSEIAFRFKKRSRRRA